MKKILLMIGCIFPLSAFANDVPFVFNKNSYFQDDQNRNHPIGDILYRDLINQPSGIAGLDSNGNYSGKSVGDVSSAQITSSSNTIYTTTAISICGYDPEWAPTPGGTGFSVGDELISGGDGSIVKILTVDSKGAATSISLVTPGINHYDPTGLSTDSYGIPGKSNSAGTKVCIKPTQATASSISGAKKSISSLIQKTVNDFYTSPSMQDVFNYAISKNAGYIKLGEGAFPNTTNGLLDKPGMYRGHQDVWFVDTLGIDADTLPIYSANGSVVNFNFPYAGYNYPTIGMLDSGLPTLTVGRVDNGNVDNTAPTLAFNLVNDDANHGNGWTSMMNKRNLNVNTWVTKNAVGPTMGLSVNMQDDGNGGYVQQNFPFSVFLAKTGLSWDWAISDSITEVGGVDYTAPDRNVGGNNPVEFEGEHNLNGLGYDTKDSAYGSKFFRVNQLASTGIYPTYAPFWTASTAFKAKHMIRVVDSSTGMQYLYTTDADGTTGTTQPTFTFNETSPVPDGTIKWIFLGKLTYQVGVAFQASGSCTQPIDYPKGYTGPIQTYCAQLGDAFSASSHIYGTAFDASNATFEQNGAHSWARTQTGTYIDFTADGTLLGLDKHLLGYENGNGLVYKVKKDMSVSGPSETWINALSIDDSSITHIYDESTPISQTDTASNSTHSDGLSTTQYLGSSENSSRFNSHGEFSSTVSNTQFGYFGNDYTHPDIMSWITYNSGDSTSGYEWWNYSSYTNDGPHQLMLLNPTGFYLTNRVPLLSVYNKTSLDNGSITTDGSGNLQVKSLLPLASITSQTFATIQSGNYTEGEKVWCHDCRSPSQATGTGTGRWIYLDSAKTWRTEDGLLASN